MNINNIIGFIKKYWVILVAAVAIILSAVFLATGIKIAHSVDKKYIEDSSWDAMPVAISAIAQSDAQPELAEQVADEYLLAFDTFGQQPSAKDIGINDAVSVAASTAKQIFGAQLDGEICHAYFESSDMRIDNTGRWQIEFGNNSPNSFRHAVVIDSLSGKPSFALKYQYQLEGEEAPYTEPAISPAGFAQFRLDAIAQSREIVQRYFPQEQGIEEILANDLPESTAKTSSWSNTEPGYAPDISVFVILEDGTEIMLIYSTRDGFLKEAYFAQLQTGISTKAMPSATTPAPAADPAQASEFDYSAHWE